MQVIQLLGSTLGLALMSGINLYATVLTIGLGIKFDLIQLPAHLSGLSILAQPEILITAGVLYLIEFFVDKIPWLDSFWDSFHTIIRPVGAALLAAAAFSKVDPALQIVVILLCGGVSLSSHSAKAGTRLVANQSPEPVSNIFLSIIEDLLVIGGSLFVLNHPIASLVIVGILVLLFAIFSPRLYRMLKFELIAVSALAEDLFHPDYLNGKISMIEKIPDNYLPNLPDLSHFPENAFFIKCFSGRGIKGGRNRSGYLYMHDNSLFFISKRFMGIRKHQIDMSQVSYVKFEMKFLYCRIILFSAKKRTIVNFLKNRKEVSEKAADLIRMKLASR